MPKNDEPKAYVEIPGGPPPEPKSDWVPCRVYAKEAIPGCRRVQLDPERDAAEYCSFAGVVRFIYGGTTWELSIHGPYGLVVNPVPTGKS